jgi:acyl carrier protein
MDALRTRSQSMPGSKLQAVIEIIAKTLDIPADGLGPDSSMDNTPTWDSIGHLTICMEFERRFGRSLDLDTIVTTSNVRDLAALVP